MLVLTRKAGESIVIGDNVVIDIMEIKGKGRVKIGVKAPQHVPVSRGELPNRPPSSPAEVPETAEKTAVRTISKI